MDRGIDDMLTLVHGLEVESHVTSVTMPMKRIGLSCVMVLWLLLIPGRGGEGGWAGVTWRLGRWEVSPGLRSQQPGLPARRPWKPTANSHGRHQVAA